jgi:uncharacterized protein (TIGR02231 family)
MKGLVTLAAILFSIQLFSQKQIVVNAPVDRATVFLNGAQLFHNASVAIPAGQSEIIIQGLAASIDQNSIQGGGKGAYTILDIQYRLFYPEPVLTSPELTAIDKKIMQVQDSINLIDFELRSVYNRKDVLNVQKQIMLNNKLLKGAGSDSLLLIQQSIEYYDTKLNEIFAAQLALDRSEFKINQEKSKLQIRLAELQNYRNQQAASQNPNAPVPQIVMSVAADAALTAKVEVNYLTTMAGWYATYDIRASDISKPVDLAYKANIWQNSGIDWKDVKLTCSTGNPSLGNTLPELTTWYLGYYNYYYERDYKEGSMPATSVDEVDGYLGNKKQLDDQNAGQAYNYTTQVQTIANVEFDINLKYSIPSDGKGHIVALQTKQLPSTYNYLIVPKLDQSAFLIARITEWESISLLPGNANIYFNNTYVGKTTINPLTLSDTLSLSLGRDNSIEVKRTQVADKSTDRIIGTNNKKTMAFSIEVRNGKSIPVEIIVKDHIPISQSDDIKVELLEKSGGELDELSGIITWREKVKPKESRKYKLEFEITYPKNETLSLY